MEAFAQDKVYNHEDILTRKIISQMDLLIKDIESG